MNSRPGFHLNVLFRLCGISLLSAAAVVYLVYRQRYVGACDWFGYFELGRLLGHGKVLLEVPLPVETYPSLVPLGFIADGARALPQYPPGYPLLMAVAGWFRGEFLVTPVIGVLSVGLMFLVARSFANRWIALAVAALWAFCPIVVSGSTNVMSDLVATVPILGSYLLYRHGWMRTSALMLGLSFWVRPTNVLYGLVFAGILLRDRILWRYVFWTLPTVTIYALYNHFLYGAPWRTGYANIGGDLTAEVFAPHLWFYLRETSLQLGVLLPCVLSGLLRGRRSDNFFLVAWAGAHLLFYSFWRSGGDAWGWTRFLLPSYPALFLLAANGLQQMDDWVRARPTPALLRPAAFAGLCLFTVLGLGFNIHRSFTLRGVWSVNKGRSFYDVVHIIENLIPSDAFVGSVEFGGAFHVYGRNTPFISIHSNAPSLVHDLLARQQPVFVLVEPWNRERAEIQKLFAPYTVELVQEIALWGGLPLYRLNTRSDAH